MTEKFEVFWNKPETTEDIGWIKVDEDGDIEWELDEGNPYYSQLEEAILDVENGDADISGGLTGVVVEEREGEPNLYGEKEAEPGPGDIQKYIMSQTPNPEIGMMSEEIDIEDIF